MFRKSLVNAIALAMLVVLAPLGRAQDQQVNVDPHPVNIDNTIRQIRTSMQADRNTIISSAMSLNEQEAAVFWPIYRKYEFERSQLDDRRVTVIKEYAEKFPNLTEADAEHMLMVMLECEEAILKLKRKYFKEFKKSLPALTVVKFFQLDHRVDLLMDFQVEGSLPPLAQKPGVEPQK